MRDFNDLSGPWTGLSTQEGVRLSESISLTIRAGQISGSGTDIDGDFDLDGTYTEGTQLVRLTRRYSRVTDPNRGTPGLPYDYMGRWDGAMVTGMWRQRDFPANGGPFEMWPSREEDMRELQIQLEEQPTTAGA
jgi:hypothetical protein